jgi:hypothetical protein
MNKTSILILLVCILAGLCGCNTPPWKEYVVDPSLRITQLDRQVIGDIRTRQPHLGLPTAVEKFQDECGTPALRIFLVKIFTAIHGKMEAGFSRLKDIASQTPTHYTRKGNDLDTPTPYLFVKVRTMN